ncbi:MAG: hypothetical protein ACE5JB_01345 [bacterium]
MDFFKAMKKNWFNIIALFLGIILVLNLAGGFTHLDLFCKRLTDKRLVTDEVKWRAWLNHNSDLFASLAEGAQIGITKNLDSDYGVIWRKQKNGFEVRRTNQLRKDGPGIILAFDDQVAKDLQWKKNREEAIVFLRHRSRIGKIQTYYLKNEEKLKAEGFLEFLRDIGLRPL